MFSAFNSCKNAFFMPGCGTMLVESLEDFINHPEKYKQIYEQDMSLRLGIIFMSNAFNYLLYQGFWCFISLACFFVKRTFQYMFFCFLNSKASAAYFNQISIMCVAVTFQKSLIKKFNLVLLFQLMEIRCFENVSFSTLASLASNCLLLCRATLSI